jgi:L-asparagine oxygenase
MTIIELTEEEYEFLLNLANRIIANPSQNPDIFCKECSRFSKYIPGRLKNILQLFATHGSSTGFLLIKNCKIENLEKTPSGNQQKIGENTTLARIQAILIHSMGEMIAYEAEGYGRLFQDVVPIQCMENTQASVGSGVELEIHTEQGFSKLRPDLLSLACLRGDPGAFTHILPVKSIIDNLTPRECELLREPLWKIGVDLSFKLHGLQFADGDIRGPIPILCGPFEDQVLVFDQDLMIGITEEAEDLLKKIVEIYYKNKIAHNLKPGEIIFIDNTRAVHGRSPFYPKYDGRDRFLVRCFATFDLEKSVYARGENSRTIKAIYS